MSANECLGRSVLNTRECPITAGSSQDFTAYLSLVWSKCESLACVIKDFLALIFVNDKCDWMLENHSKTYKK